MKMRELDSNKEWKKWGETDPLYGVASWQNKNKMDCWCRQAAFNITRGLKRDLCITC